MLSLDTHMLVALLDGSLRPGEEALVEGIPLLTRDRRILRSKIVPLAR
jgi:hypothetical protein